MLRPFLSRELDFTRHYRRGFGLDSEAAAKEQQMKAGSTQGMLPPASDKLRAQVRQLIHNGADDVRIAPAA